MEVRGGGIGCYRIEINVEICTQTLNSNFTMKFTIEVYN